MNDAVRALEARIANPAQPGFATVWASGAWPGSSNINFSAGQNVATLTAVGLASGTFQVLSNVTADVVIDAVGYFI